MNLRTILRTAGAALATTAVLGFASASAQDRSPRIAPATTIVHLRFIGSGSPGKRLLEDVWPSPVRRPGLEPTTILAPSHAATTP